MGLDMWFIVKEESKTLNTMDMDTFSTPVHYFRKHSDLHGWLMEIWLKQNPTKQKNDFDTVFLEITQEIVDKLKEYCKTPIKNRPHYTGLFWGESGDKDWKETEEELIPNLEKALSNLKGDEKVYYFPFW